MNVKPTLGEKIRFYRKRAEMSQLGLETAIDASPGSISRIESGQVHPTMETIHKISKALNLNKDQITDLFDIADDPVSEQEIKDAINAIESHYKKPGTLSHLMDDRWNVRYFSKSFEKLLNFTDEEVSQMQGQNIMTLIYDSNSPYHKRMDKQQFHIFADHVASRKREDFLQPITNPWVAELFNHLNQYPPFQESWEKVKDNPLEYFSNESRTVFFDINGKKFKALYGREVIKTCPRFYVVEYSVV